MELSADDSRLLAALEGGLAFAPRPYAALAAAAGMSEVEAIGRLKTLLDEGAISRLGLIVRHHELGYRANAMVVWDHPDDTVDAVGARMSAFPFVTLCYRRPRRPPDWPYNLFCMIHGRDRATVLAQIDELVSGLGLEGVRRDVLFSRRRFKQRGARYSRRAEQGVA